MSLIDLTLITTGSISALAIIIAILWLLINLVQEIVLDPSISNIAALTIVLCICIFIGVFTYVKTTDQNTTEYQQYLELKAKYEKDSK